MKTIRTLESDLLSSKPGHDIAKEALEELIKEHITMLEVLRV